MVVIPGIAMITYTLGVQLQMLHPQAEWDHLFMKNLEHLHT